MIFFIVGIILVVLMTLSERDTKRKYTNSYLAIAVLTLVCMAGFRRESVDYAAYELIYQRVPSILELIHNPISLKEIHGETGFLLLNALIKECGGAITSVMFCCACISMIFLFKAAKQFSPMPIMVILLYYCRFFIDRDLGQIRSGIACSMFLYSLKYIEARNLKKYLAVVCMAALFHKVALITVPVYWLARIDIKNKMIISVWIISFFIGYLIDFHTILTVDLYGKGVSVVDGYVNWDKKYTDDLGLFYPVMIVQILIMCVAMKYRQSMTGDKEYGKFLMNIYFLSTIWLLSFHSIGVYAGRVATVFASVEPLLMVWIYSIFNKRCVLGMIMTYGFVVLLFKLVNTGYACRW